MPNTSSSDSNNDTPPKILTPFSEHNTPPPTLLAEGSLIIEVTNANMQLPNPLQVGNRQLSLIRPTPYPNGAPVPQTIYIAHLKVVDGCGDLLYALDNTQSSDKATPVEVTATVRKPNTGDTFTCHLTVEGDSFAIDVPTGKTIDQKPGDPPNPRRQNRVRFMEAGGGTIDDAFDFINLSINKGNRTLYNQDLTELASRGKELRVLIWWEGP